VTAAVTDRRTANDRFKASWGRTLRFGLLSAALLEFGVLVFWPTFHVPVIGNPYRLIVVVDTLTRIEWPGGEDEGAGRVPADAIAPRINNIDAVQMRVHEQYPADLWRLRIEDAITVRLSIDRRGRVGEVDVIEPGEDPAADAATARLAALLRFEPAVVDGRKVPVRAELRISVEEPLPPPPRRRQSRPQSSGRLL
jgi:TonB family protein